MNQQRFRQSLTILMLITAISACSAPASSSTPVSSTSPEILASPVSAQGATVPQEGYWLNDPAADYQITVLIKDRQIQWVDLSGSMPEGSLHCVFGKTPATSIQPDGTFKDDDGGGAQISGAFATPTTGHVTFMFTGPWCSGTTNTGQSASFNGTVSDKTDIQFDH